MFEYFPRNYPWSLAVHLALQCGGAISEIDDACRPLIELSTEPDDKSLAPWQTAWAGLRDRLEVLAAGDLERGFRLAAAAKYQRAAAYALMTERMMRGHGEARNRAYERARDLVKRVADLRRDPAEWVEVPYQSTSLPGILFKARGPGPKPCLIGFSGFDVSKEYLYLFGLGQELARRGISILFIDHPGVGEALRLRNLHAFPETERATAPCVDFLAKRNDIDPSRIGVMGVSLGGYYAARSAAHEPRLAACICWGGQWDYGEITRGRAKRQGTALSVSSWAEHAQWVFGVNTMDEVLAIADRMTLAESAPLIRCPLLVVHGENDRQIPVAHARTFFEHATNATPKELKIFTKETGGTEHCQADNSSIGIDYWCDWAAETFSTGQ
jgi:dienelactone hydrolase